MNIPKKALKAALLTLVSLVYIQWSIWNRPQKVTFDNAAFVRSITYRTDYVTVISSSMQYEF